MTEEDWIGIGNLIEELWELETLLIINLDSSICGILTSIKSFLLILSNPYNSIKSSLHNLFSSVYLQYSEFLLKNS